MAAERYGHFVNDVMTTSPKAVFFALPNTVTIIKDVIVCNTDTDSRKFSLAIVKNGEVLSTKDYIFYEVNIGPKESITISGMLSMDPGSELYVVADKSDVITVNAFGVMAGTDIYGSPDESASIFINQWQNIKKDIDDIKRLLTWQGAV